MQEQQLPELTNEQSWQKSEWDAADRRPDQFSLQSLAQGYLGIAGVYRDTSTLLSAEPSDSTFWCGNICGFASSKCGKELVGLNINSPF